MCFKEDGLWINLKTFPATEMVLTNGCDIIVAVEMSVFAPIFLINIRNDRSIAVVSLSGIVVNISDILVCIGRIPLKCALSSLFICCLLVSLVVSSLA